MAGRTDPCFCRATTFDPRPGMAPVGESQAGKLEARGDAFGLVYGTDL